MRASARNEAPQCPYRFNVAYTIPARTDRRNRRRPVEADDSMIGFTFGVLAGLATFLGLLAYL